MADVNQEEGERLSRELGPDTFFARVDVSVYEQQAGLFAEAFKWGGNRLDVLAANAGIDDRQSLFAEDATVSWNEDGTVVPPLPLNTKTVSVNLEAVLQGIWLFKFFARQNRPLQGGKIVITASAAAF